MSIKCTFVNGTEVRLHAVYEPANVNKLVAGHPMYINITELLPKNFDPSKHSIELCIDYTGDLKWLGEEMEKVAKQSGVGEVTPDGSFTKYEVAGKLDPKVFSKILEESKKRPEIVNWPPQDQMN